MAQLTGKLGADFSAFYDAVTKADAYVTDLSAGADRAGTRLKTMQDSLSGKAIVQQATLAAEAVERIGGVSMLTQQELVKVGTVAQQAAEKLSALGREVPPQIQGLADALKQVTVAAADGQQKSESFFTTIAKGASILATLGAPTTAAGLLALGKNIILDADALTMMSDKTGIAVTTLQQMRIAGDDAGVTLEAMTSAATMLQKRVGGGAESVVSALGDLGINFQEFRSLDAVGMFVVLSDAVKRSNDPLRTAADLAAIFGKSWADQLPVLKRGFQEVKDNIQLMSSGGTKALDDFGDATGRLWQKFKANLGEGIADILTLSLADLRRLNDEIKNIPSPPDASKFENFFRAVVPPGLPADLDEIIHKLDAQITAQIKTSEAMVELNSAGLDWKGTVEGINGAIVEAIKGYLDAGVSQHALAIAYGLTETQVKAVGMALKDSTEALKLEEKATTDSATRWAQYTATKVQLSGSTTQKLNAEIDVWVAKEIESHVKAKTDTADFYTWLGAQATASRELQDRQRLLSDSNSRTSYEQRKTAAEDWFQFVMAHTSEFTNADIEQAAKRTQAATQEWATWGAVSSAALDKTIAKEKQLADAAGAATRAMGSSMTYDLSTVAGVEAYRSANTGMNVSWSDAQIIAFIQGGGNLQQLFQQGVITMRPYAQGGPTTAGPAMLHDAEYVVPKDGALVSGGGGGIGPVTIHVMMPDGQTLASVVIDALTRDMMQGRLWPARA